MFVVLLDPGAGKSCFSPRQRSIHLNQDAVKKLNNISRRNVANICTGLDRNHKIYVKCLTNLVAIYFFMHAIGMIPNKTIIVGQLVYEYYGIFGYFW